MIPADDLELVPGLAKTSYVFDARHILIASDAWKHDGPNIGRTGGNLTISFLSLNRATLSEKLLLSIRDQLPGFAGEVLVIDNGSVVSELNHVRAICAAMPYKSRIVELGKNFGVGGGRNRTLPHVTTEWIMFLDNDIYFLSNPLPQFQRELATLGCHFMSLPLLDPDGETLFAKGGHLYVSFEGNELHIGAGSACAQKTDRNKSTLPFLGTFLFGGACIVNLLSFKGMDGYDEAMFVGFEDIDFSVRLFQRGYKVGASGCSALVHDHPKPGTDIDRNYEKERFSRSFLYESALHLENKHGFKVWSDGVDHWLEARHRDLDLRAGEINLGQVTSEGDFRPSSTPKPKIALIIDTDNWAFGNISRQLRHHLSGRFDFVDIPMDIIDNVDHVLMMVKDCQVVHFFWREHLQLIGSPYFRSYIESLGANYADFEREHVHPKIFSTSIYDHLLLQPHELDERRNLFTDFLAGYTVASEKLNVIYRSAPGYPAPTMVIEDGVDLSIFHPRNLERFSSVSRRNLIIGWVGNSKWAAELEDFKGVHTVLKPAIDRLLAEGLPITMKLADRQDRFIPHREMPEYYQSIDVLVCTSKIEGTPNPILEAMACGVPVISTDVGIVPQAFGELQKQFILAERSVDALCALVRRLLVEPTLLSRLSDENQQRIQSWDWAIQANKFGDYFSELLVAKNA